MNVYLDANVVVALFTHDPFSGRADAFLRREGPVLTLSDFARARSHRRWPDVSGPAT